MTKIFKYLFVEISLFFVFVLLFPPIFIKENIVINREGGQAVYNLKKNTPFTEIINTHAPNLNSISIQLKNPQIKNNSLIIVSIFDLNDNLLKDFSFYGSNVGDPSWIKLKLEPLTQSSYKINVTTDNTDDNDLYLYINKDNQMDLKTTSYLPGFKNRFLLNINYQVKLFMERSMWHNILYLTTLIVLNLYLAKLLNEIYKKT